MNINPLIIETLKDLEIPVEPILYTGTSKTYITFYTYSDRTTVYADDEPLFDKTSGTVDIYTTVNYKELVKDVKRRLRSAGFSVSQGPETYETDTEMYHIIIEINIESESEE